MHPYQSTGMNPRRRSTMFNKRWIGRNASEASLKRYCSEIWSNLVMERDHHKCFICGNAGWLNAHHLITRMWLATAFNINCGISLCHSCHSLDVLSAHASPWFLEEKIKSERPEQYKWMLVAKSTINTLQQPKLNYHLVLDSLMAEYEKLSPTKMGRHGNFKFSKQEESEIVHDFEILGCSSIEISSKWKCSPVCIKEVLLRYGIDSNNELAKKRTREKMRRIFGHGVVKLDDNGSILNEYPSMNMAAKEHGLCINAIRNCLKGLSKSSGGFKWAYKKDLLNAKAV